MGMMRVRITSKGVMATRMTNQQAADTAPLITSMVKERFGCEEVVLTRLPWDEQYGDIYPDAALGCWPVTRKSFRGSGG